MKAKSVFKPALLAAVGLLGLPAGVHSETMERSVFSSSGRVTQAATVTLSYTVGETSVLTGASGTTALGAGYQQPSGYDFWSSANHLATGPLADPDKDGIVNLLEYAFGTDPNNPASKAQATASIGPGGKLYISATKNPLATGLTWSAEGSTNLVAWSTQPVNVALDTATTFTALFTGNAPAAFLRLRIGLSGSN